MLKVFALDDSRQQLEYLEININVYNKKQNDESDKIHLETETDYKKYVEKIDSSYDIALMDIDLKNPEINGFGVAMQLYERYGSNLIYIMCSSSVDTHEEYDSLLSKSFSNIAAELFSRFQELRIHPLENRAQILFSKDEFPNLAHV